jgi:hypothetical protein
VRLYAEPGSEEFLEAYWRARKGEAPPAKPIPLHLRDAYPVRVEEAAERIFASARKHAYGRQIAFPLTLDEALALLRHQNHRCAVSGLKFKPRDKTSAPGVRLPFAPSLDRIDCAKGYENGNVRWVLTAVNIALADWGEDQLVEIAKAIVRKRKDTP